MTFREWYKEKYETEWNLGNSNEVFETAFERFANHLIEFTEDCIKYPPVPNTPKPAQGK